MSDRAERLVNLTIALLETRRPLTLAEIRSRTGYYQQADPETGRRMFERDKEALRGLGVPVETRSTDAFDRETGYQIHRSQYELPDLELTGEEMTALAVALRLAGTDGAHLGLAKLAARAPDPAGAPTTPVTRMDPLPKDLGPLSEAITERRAVEFTYRDARGELSSRRVDPWTITLRRGKAYLVGHDHGRDAMRAFRVDRIAGEVRPAEEAGTFEPPADLDADSAVTGPTEPSVAAELLVDEAACWSLEQRGATRVGAATDGRARYAWTAPAGEIISVALELLDTVEVIGPAPLRERTREQLTRLVAAHEHGV